MHEGRSFDNSIARRLHRGGVYCGRPTSLLCYDVCVMRFVPNIKWVSHISKKVSTFVVLLAGVVLFSSVLIVKGSLVFAIGGESFQERRSALFPDPINFTFKADKVFFNIKDGVFLEDSDTAVVLTSTPDRGTPPLLYRLRTSASGDTALCEAINVTSEIPQFEGQFQSLDFATYDSNTSSWEFNFSLAEGVVLGEEVECIVTVHLLGWDETRTMHLEKYRAENFIELTFKAENPNLFKSLFETISNSLINTPKSPSGGEELSVDVEITTSTSTPIVEGGEVSEIEINPADVSDTLPLLDQEVIISEASSTPPVIEPEIVLEGESPHESQTTPSDSKEALPFDPFEGFSPESQESTID